MAVGVLGLTPADLAQLEMIEVEEALIARFAYDRFRERAAWEQTRVLSYFTVSPHLKKGSNKQPKDLLPLTWDNDAAGQQKTGKFEFSQAEKDWIERQKKKHGR